MKSIFKLCIILRQNAITTKRKEFIIQGLLRAALTILLGLLHIIGMTFLTSKSFTEVIAPN